MKDFQNKVAVVTGAASGIGYALAEKSARLGMKVVLADVEEPALKWVEAELNIKLGVQLLMDDILEERSPTHAYALARQLALQADQ
jgi:NAD(P)-dependent dehydrogenase (short-subunit alcohol dehydrogenase family)